MSLTRSRAGVGGTHGVFGSVLALALAVACGSSKDDDLFKGSEVTGNGGQVSGSGGSTSDGSAPKGTGGIVVSCADPAKCPVGPGQVGCCTNDYKCGIRIGQGPPYECVTPDPVTVENPSCPNTFALSGAGHGCCRSDHTCGYLDMTFGAGCMDPKQLNLAPGKPCQ